MILYILPSNAKTLLELFCNSNCIYICSHMTLSSSSNVNIVQRLGPMPAVGVFSSSDLTLCFGLAGKDHIFDGRAFDVLIKKFQVQG